MRIPLFKVAMSEEASTEVSKVLQSGYIGQGSKVEEFEKLLLEKTKIPYLVTLNSCTSALHLALHLIKTNTTSKNPVAGIPEIKKGDEVLTSPLTCTATNWPILANNLNIKWVDVNKKNLNLDIEDLKNKLSAKTKIIFLVHWGGYPADLDKFSEVQQYAQQKFGFTPIIVEDCAHAWGSTYKGRHLGNHGNIAAFSFQAIKHLTCGDGGMLTMPDSRAYQRAKLLRWYGIDRENRPDFRCESDVAEFGFKFHMNDINASIGLANLKGIDKIVARHRQNANYYLKQLKNIPGIEFLENSDDRESSYWIFTILVERRENFIQRMTEEGIQVSRVHERNDIHSCVSRFRDENLKNLEEVVKKMICIPVGWWISDDDREFIVETIKKGW